MTVIANWQQVPVSAMSEHDEYRVHLHEVRLLESWQKLFMQFDL